MPTTIRDIARSLNISHTTVSRVLNGRGSDFISEETRQRVQRAASDMNYRPNPAARKLATGRANMIAVWMGDPFHPYFAAVSHYVEAQLRQHNLDMLHIASNRPHQENDFSYFVDGILALDGFPEVDAFLEQAAQPHPPVVSMGVSVSRRVDYVEVDLSAGTREAVTHLLAAGCKRVPFVHTDWAAVSGDRRLPAYTATMEEHGRAPELWEIPDSLLRKGRSSRAARLWIRERLQGADCPDGIFCFSDDIALGAYRALRDLGIRIPDDVLLVGCDGIEEGEYLDPALSTIIQPYEALCARAWALLKRRMDDPTAPLTHETLSATFVPRESSRPR